MRIEKARNLAACTVAIIAMLVIASIALPAVVDDHYEENDDRAQRHILSASPGKWLSEVGGVAVQGDEDWFLIDKSGFTFDPIVLIECRFRRDAGAMKVAVLGSGGTTEALSLPAGNSERIVYLASDTVSKYVRVFSDGTAGNRGNPYDLWWDWIKPGDDDAYEPNDSRTAAFDLRPYEGRWLTTISGTGLYRNNEDWYRIEAAPGGEWVQIDCRFLHNRNDLNLELVDATGNVVAWSRTATDDEWIAQTVAGVHYIRVYSVDPVGIFNPYDLRWEAFSDGEDAFEWNNTILESYWPGADWAAHLLSNLGGKATYTDDDWYTIPVPSGKERLLVGCYFSHAQGDIDLELHTAGTAVWHTPLAVADTPSDNEYLDVAVPSPGLYYLRVAQSGWPGTPAGNEYDLMYVTTKDSSLYGFAGLDAADWTWFDFAPALPAPDHELISGSVTLTERPGSVGCFGSWESPKNPVLAPHPGLNRVLRARYWMRSSVNGATCPGFRFRAVTAHVDGEGNQWNPDFRNPDFNSQMTVYYSTLDLFHVEGREPGTTGSVYTLLSYPQQTASLQDPSMVTYFTCDLVDIDTMFDDQGTLFLDYVVIDSFDRPAAGTGEEAPLQSFDSFSSWTIGIHMIDPAKYNGSGLNVRAGPTGAAVLVQPGNQWFEAYAVSPPSFLGSGFYYRSIFRIESSETGTGDFGPTVRAGFASSELVFSADKELPGGSSLARLGPIPQDFEVWMVAPSPSLWFFTEPMSLRFESWLGDSNTGFPFFKNVSGTVRCTSVFTEYFESL